MRNLLTILFLLVLIVPNSKASDLTSIEDAANKSQNSVNELIIAVDRLPEQVQNAIGSDIKLLGQEVIKTLGNIQNLSASPISKTLLVDVDHVGEISKALTNRFIDLEKKNTKINNKFRNSVSHLFVLLSDLQSEIQGEIDNWSRLKTNSVLKVEKTNSGYILNSINRSNYNKIRFACTVLFLVGLLILGIRIFDKSFVLNTDSGSNSNSTLKVFSVLVLSLFFIANIALIAKPELLLKETSEKTFYPVQTNCDFYRRHETHMQRAKSSKLSDLIDVIVAKVEQEKSKCFGKKSAK